ncbi:MAG: carbamoyl-phosphate synthase large subunit [Solirubrobacterales bacterium]|nr:carbamoyl-phosphate synthase large subunit [Solirubrobacterales bacterium]
MPYALDIIRKLAERGHDVYASDNYDTAPGSHSKYLKGHTVTASPSGDPEAFVGDVESYCSENGIELVVPCFEEVFYLAAQHERLSGVTKVYAPPFATLARVHDKASFESLADKLGIRAPQTIVAHTQEELTDAIGKFPRFFARAAFSRGGVGLLTNTGPLAGAMDASDAHPTEASPWLVQEFVDGPMQCTYATIHEGRVVTHGAYRAPRQWEHSTGIQFVSVDPKPSLEAVNKIVAELNWTGQMSLDFVDTDDGLVIIECNPRGTDGVLLMEAEELERGVLGGEGETLLIEPGREVQLDFAVFGQAFREPIKEMPASFHDLMHIKGSDSGWRDALPTLYSALSFAHHARLNWGQRKALLAAMADGITWDGQPIPGLPPDDAKLLAELTGDRPPG